MIECLSMDICAAGGLDELDKNRLPQQAAYLVRCPTTLVYFSLQPQYHRQSINRTGTRDVFNSIGPPSC